MQVQFSFRKKEFFAFSLYFFILITLLIVTHRTFLGVQDEAQLYATLKANEPLNYMTSYPFALLGGYLYTHFPSFQWYSILITFYILLLTLLFSWYLASIRTSSKIDAAIKALLFTIFTLMTLHMLFRVDVTTPTLLLIVMAIPFIHYNHAYFWFTVWIATFLRSQIIISLFPLLIIAYFTMVTKAKPKRKEILLSILFIILTLSTHFSYKLNPTYDKWMEFTEKRAYFTDFGGAPIHNNLTPDEFHLARTWWIIDQDLYPYKKVMADAGSTIDIIHQRFEHLSPKRYIAFIFKNHTSLYFLFLLSLLVSIYYRSFLKLAGYIAFGSVVILLLIVKDVDRVTMPILLMWWSMIISDLWCIKSKKWLSIQKAILLSSLVWVLYFLVNDIPWNRIQHYKQREALVKELRNLLKNNQMQLEITTGFTSSWEYLIETIMQNHLFDEKNWIDYYDDLLLQGWFSRVPLVYKQHNISFNGVARKYNHYHDWLLAPNSGFLGSTGEDKHIQPFLAKNLLRLYNHKYPHNNCSHTTVIVDQSEHFVIHKMTLLCKNTKVNPLIDLTKKNQKISYKDIDLNDSTLIARSSDPNITLNYNKSVPGLIRLDLEMSSSKNTFFQVFYRSDEIKQFNQINSIKRDIIKGKNRISVILPGKFLRFPLRIDVVSKKGEYKIEKFQIGHLEQ